MSSAPQGALLLDGLPEQSPEHFEGLAQRHGKTGAELAAMLGRSGGGSDQALRNTWSRIKSGARRITPMEHAGLLLQLGEHPLLQIVRKDVDAPGNVG